MQKISVSVPASVDSSEIPEKYSENDLLVEVLSHWPGAFVRRVDSIELPGSPERTQCRWLWLDAAGKFWILEGSAAARRIQREKQAERLDFLRRAGLPVQYFIPAESGQFGWQNGGIYWQLRPWIDGETLPREDYGKDLWRGQEAAKFLFSMKQAVPDNLTLFQAERFSLLDYIPMIMKVFQRRKPALCHDLEPILKALQPFLEHYSDIPEMFCHGDYHPLNIIWGKQRINCVIDWEFSGRKIELYDAANLLGCLGMDNPEFLTGSMIRGFMAQAGKDGLFHEESWQWLPECIVALRFAWMREWVYRNQLPMICQELDFMYLMADNFRILKQKWRAIVHSAC